MESLIKTEEQFQNFDDALKDTLCREYRWIEKTINNKTYSWLTNFTADAVMMCCQCICITGRCSQKYADTFIANLEKIKTLVDNQPTINVEVTFSFKIELNEELIHTEVDYIQTYQEDKVNDFIKSFKERKGYTSHKII